MAHGPPARNALGRFGAHDQLSQTSAEERRRDARGLFVAAVRVGADIKDDAIHPDDRGTPDAQSALDYLLETRADAEQLHLLYKREHRLRHPVHLLTSVLADFASYPFLVVQAGKGLTFTDIYLHGGALSAAIWTEILTDRVSKRTTERRLDAIDKLLKGLRAHKTTVDLSSVSIKKVLESDWLTTLLVTIWTSEAFAPVIAEYSLAAAVPDPSTSLFAITTTFVGLIAKAWLPLVCGMDQSKTQARAADSQPDLPVRLRVKSSETADAIDRTNGRPRRQLGVFARRADAGHDPWSFLVGPTGPPLRITEQEALEARWPGQSWSFGDTVDVLPAQFNADNWQRAIFGPAARVNGLPRSVLEAHPLTDPHSLASHRLWNYRNTAAAFLFRTLDYGPLKSDAEIATHYGFAGDE